MPTRGFIRRLTAEAGALRRHLDVLDPRGRRARHAGHVQQTPCTSSPTGSSPPRSRRRRSTCCAPNNDEVPGISTHLRAAEVRGRLGPAADVAQRIVYPVHITFTSTAGFDDIPDDDDFRRSILYATHGPLRRLHPAAAEQEPEPAHERRRPAVAEHRPARLQDQPGRQPTAGIEHPAAVPTAPTRTSRTSSTPTTTGTAPAAIPSTPCPPTRTSTGSSSATNDVDGNPVFNYAIARVRFRAPEGIDAADVRVFFRMWTTGWTALEYDLNGSYRRSGNGPSATPLLGLHGGEINNVPCFAEPRAGDMEHADRHDEPPHARGRRRGRGVRLLRLLARRQPGRRPLPARARRTTGRSTPTTTPRADEHPAS